MVDRNTEYTIVGEYLIEYDLNFTIKLRYEFYYPTLCILIHINYEILFHICLRSPYGFN